ncbi:Pleiotropic regulator of exopolysaccharide synthe sis, competence and biofilm formation Ftr, XRE family [Streptococcus gallolyticus]|uniref:Pleiotropic regulator of exopolysaccharide synthe sis, competence and biofilm formation Ftr, XRE family n=1 Tax=Streptococcus gallolyticus TaxID=315405 RepID=A0A060RFY0_9STRE|nr:S24 family peptidase [Streptococcus gallolyticus]CDO17309.1 Pleiotropic regulator of exopolysaccharide synthe sis, competence and biofilm formation Ftr, XRE family [Streptococcus gallolyticus]
MFSGKRLKERRTALGYSQSQIANYLGINRASYNQWESEKTKPNQKNLALVADYLGVDKAYFESEYPIVSTYLQLTQPNQQKLVDYADVLLDAQNNIIKLFPVQVLDDISLSAGSGEMIGDEYTTREVFADRDYSYDVATWIKGNSMEPTYLNGEVALIRETGFDYDGAVYALVCNGESFIKKVYREATGIRLVSINPTIPDRFFSYEEEPKIIGKVIGHFMPIE